MKGFEAKPFSIATIQQIADEVSVSRHRLLLCNTEYSILFVTNDSHKRGLI